MTQIDEIVRRLQALERTSAGRQALGAEKRGDYDWTDLEVAPETSAHPRPAEGSGR